MKRICVFIFLLTLISSLSADDWVNYTESDGLGSNDVRAILIDPEGVKWFGTANGITRFDGMQWTTYRKTESVQTLADNAVNDLAYENGSYGPELWIATDNGVSVMGFDVDAVTFATPYRTDNRELLSNQVNAVAVDQANTRYFGTDAGLNVMSGSEWDAFTAPHKLTSAEVLVIGVDNAGGWRYIGTQSGGANRLKVEVDGITTASPYDYDWSGLYSNQVNDIHVKANGHQWFATEEGVAYHDTNETKSGWINYFSENGLGDDHVKAVVEDANGITWFGTTTGVSVFNGTSWRRISVDQGLISNQIQDIAVDKDGSLWFATDSGVSHLSQGSAVHDRVDQPGLFVLHANYPNPFNPVTTLGFELKQPGKVIIDIYNTRGQLIRQVMNAYQDAGYHEIKWDGRQNNAVQAAAGMYVARMHVQSNGVQWTGNRKMLLIK